MKQLTLPYYLVEPPKAVRKARLDNIALVPASLLSKKGKYTRIANNLPANGVLICQSDSTPKINLILEQVASFFREQGHKSQPSPLPPLPAYSFALQRN